jgi:hypothetical protein
MICPRRTLSPILTTGFAGAPRCCETGKTAIFGAAIFSTGIPAVILFSAGCIPPLKAVSFISTLFQSALRICVAVFESLQSARFRLYGFNNNWTSACNQNLRIQQSELFHNVSEKINTNF